MRHEDAIPTVETTCRATRHRDDSSKSGAMMVGPMTREDRSAAMSRLKIVIVLLVGASGGLIALQSGADMVGVLAAVVSGLLLGVLLTWYLTWITR
ncbi:hypothetical protein [Haladaptatus sp. DFWS20]|uniref:hypothetical protein n=1 Tax=Haladaptatus sp. DFWS20 TaxID=3403467 RepID=UPI003EB853E7